MGGAGRGIERDIERERVWKRKKEVLKLSLHYQPAARSGSFTDYDHREHE